MAVLNPLLNERNLFAVVPSKLRSLIYSSFLAQLSVSDTLSTVSDS